MTPHPARFTPDQAPGVGAAIATLKARARRLRAKAKASPLPSVQADLRFEAAAVEVAADELRGLL